MGSILSREPLERPVLEAARDLLGRLLVRSLPAAAGGPPIRLAGRIVEVEAYDGADDLACHASRGRTNRTDPMFGEAGHAYIYLIYGMHACLNVVTGPEGYPAAVLIRALEPVDGLENMLAAAAAVRRTRPAARPASGPGRQAWGAGRLASGPGRLTRACAIDLSLNRADLCRPGPLFLEEGDPVPDRLVRRGPRIGVEYAGAWASKPWRFGVRGSPALSRPFPGRPAPRVTR
jgi:DNA-3-methyladenine glycosylase